MAGCFGARTFRILEDETVFETALFDQLHRLLKLFFRFYTFTNDFAAGSWRNIGYRQNDIGLRAT